MMKTGLKPQLMRGFSAPPSMVTIFVDDKEYKVERGLTVFQACHQVG